MANSQKKLRRLAGRVIEMVPRQVEANLQLAPFEPALTTAATAFIDRYDERAIAERRRQGLAEAAEVEVARLRERLAAWLPTVSYTLARGGGGFGLDSRVPDDLFAEADRLLELVGTGSSDGTAPYAEALLAEIEPSLRVARDARAALLEAQLARNAQGEAVKAAALSFDRELVAFRRALRAVVGPRHLDYRRLRLPRGAGEVEPVTVEASASVGGIDGTNAVNDNSDTEAAA